MPGIKGQSPRKFEDRPKVCIIEECGKVPVALGLCKSHYRIAITAENRIKQYGTLTPIGKNGKPKPGPGSFSKSGCGVAPKLIPDESTMKRIYDLAGMQCTKAEIAGVLQVSYEALKDFIKRHPMVETTIEDGRLNGKASLRRTQFVMAERSAAMGIHLGRQYLDQFDRRNPPMDAGFLTLGDPANEEAPSALLRAVKAETE